MSHHITAVIADPTVIARIVRAAECPEPTDLTGRLLIAPLGHRQIDRLTDLKPSEYIEGFGYLSEGLQDALLKAADGGTFAYIETDYFGGTGSQAAAVFAAGRMVMRRSTPIDRSPARSDDPINTALRALGVEAAPPKDEFDVIDLRRFRNLESLGLDDFDDS